MSAIITGKLFWTKFTDLSYKDKNGKDVQVKETTAKIVMLAIGDSADDYGENSWQSFERIAIKASLEKRSVIRVIRALLSHEYLAVAGITKYGTNNFSININKLGEPPKARPKNGRPKTSDSEAKTSDLESPYPSIIPPKPSKKHIPKLTNYTLLKKVEEDWKQGMLMLSVPWEKNIKNWQSFPRWLLEQEEAGRPVAQFCKWFMSDPFRAKTVGMWSPDGRKTDGSYSFKGVYLQAFANGTNGNGQVGSKSPFDEYIENYKESDYND